MYESYSFFTAPNYSNFDADSDNYETNFKALLTDERSKYLEGENVSSENALAQFKK